MIKPLLAFLIAIGVIGDYQSYAAYAQPMEPTVTEHATVINGSTIKLRGIPIRLWGIVAPSEGEIGAVEATIALYRLVDQRVVTCHLTNEQAFGISVGKCEYAGLDLGAVMVSHGHALDCPRLSGGHYALQEIRAKSSGSTLTSWYKLPKICA